MIVTLGLTPEPEDFPRKHARHGDGVRKYRGDSPTQALGLVKYPELCKHGSTVVINLFACQLIVLIECKDSAQRKFDLATRFGKSAPASQMPPTNDHLKDNSLFAYVPPPDINMQVWHRSQQLRVERTNILAT
jgi:hypothetical protein